jgi:Transposase IS4
MARRLPKIDQSYFVLYLDNYFTSMPLFSKLRAKNIGAVGTTRLLGIN